MCAYVKSSVRLLVLPTTAASGNAAVPRGAAAINLTVVVGVLIFFGKGVCASCLFQADNIEPKKVRLGLQKWLSRFEKNVIFCNYSSKFDRPANPYGHQILVAPPMEGCNRVLGSH